MGARWVIALAVVLVAGGAVSLLVQRAPEPASAVAPGVAVPAPAAAPSDPPSPSPTPSPSPSPAPAPLTVDDVYASHGLSVPDAPVPMDGCPPPPPDPGGGGEGRPDWTPPRTVPDELLPAPAPLAAWATDVAPFSGKGMWIWKYDRSEGGDYARIVARAEAAGLEQLWVRVGDSRYGFYAGERLEVLVPLAHAAGIDVVGWGFPFLHDPEHDIAWSRQAMAWRSPDGRGLDGFSPDIEMATEKVELSAHRVEVYLSHLRAAAGDLPVAATVYPPVDWVVEAGYPYETMAPYVDAFVPMDYWMCREPGGLAAESIERLAGLRPVHVIGQAFANETHLRRVPPSGDETLRFLDVAVRHGAIGASFWVWHDMPERQWDALSRFPWRDAAAATRSAPPG